MCIEKYIVLTDDTLYYTGLSYKILKITTQNLLYSHIKMHYFVKNEQNLLPYE